MKFKTRKQFNKWRHRLPLIKDSNNNRLYPFDYVRMILPMEVKSAWCSQIYWNPLSGAYVESHPTHKILDKNPNKTRSFDNIVGWMHWDNPIFKATVTKITYKEYLEWKQIQEQHETT